MRDTIMQVSRRPIPGLRWYIVGLLFLSTVINYLDRQTLSVLAPYIKKEFTWNNETFALLIISFRVAYAIGQSVSGRFLDSVGVRRGLTFAVLFYSLSALAASFATGVRSFCTFRFLLGAGESANWPGAAKVVAEWFPRKESGWAVAIFDSGSSVGGAIAPVLVFWLFHFFGGWRPAFVVTGLLGLLWIPVFRALYRQPEDHPRLSESERAMILRERADSMPVDMGVRLSYSALLRLPHTWGIVVAKTLSDPLWFFITDWFAIFLVSRGYRPENSLLAFWIPFLAADIGNFAGGGASSYLIRRGWPLLRSRRIVGIVCAAGMSTLSIAAMVDNFAWMVSAFACSTFFYSAFSTIVLTLPADLYPTRSVATVSGMSGTGAGIGTILATYLTGVVADRYSFRPVLLVASIVPLFAGLALWCLVREKEASLNTRLQ